MPSAPVAYLTDVEGMWSRVESFVARNPLVRLEPPSPQSPSGRLVVAPGALFVFGGDAIDRGPEGRRLVEVLLECKLRQPDQVVLLAGNRDINKLRLRRELGAFPHRKAPPELIGKGPELLRWTFSNTMGAGDAFEMRKRELGSAATDEDVLQSYLSDLAPGGPMVRYLAQCQLAFRTGSTIFVHGAVTQENLGLPPNAPVDGPRLPVDAWIDALNTWFRAQVQAYIDERVEPDGTPGWQGLIAYQAPLPGTRLNQQSVVYARLTDDMQTPHLPPKAVRETLQRAGIDRLVVGHTPAGDTPSVLREDGFELVMADTSHARHEEGSQVFVDDRGLHVHGPTVLDDGRRVEVDFQIDSPRAESPVGKTVESTGQLIKGPVQGEGFALWKGLANYQVEQREVTAAELEKLPLTKPRSQ